MPPAHKLVCAECGRQDPGDEPGWTLRLDVDDEPVAFCPNATEKNSAITPVNGWQSLDVAGMREVGLRTH
jgi:hypothetical protein